MWKLKFNLILDYLLVDEMVIEIEVIMEMVSRGEER